MPKPTKTTTDRLHEQKLARTTRRRRALKDQCETQSAASAPRRNDLVPDLIFSYVPVASLYPSDHRTRRTTPDQLQRVINSIRALGVSRPILATVDGEIIDGHIVHAAAIELGLDQLPVIQCPHLSDVDVRRMRLAANRIPTLGMDDAGLLKIEFESLILLEADLEATGYSKADQDIILLDDDPLFNDPDDEDIEPPAVPVSQLGDIWDLGPHNRLICGDSRDATSYRLLLGNEQVAAVVADFPFNVRIQNNVSGLGKHKHGEFVCASGEMTAEQFDEFLVSVKAAVVPHLMDGGVFFAFMDWRSIDRIYHAARQVGLEIINLVVWKKPTGGMGALYRSAHELIAVLCNGHTPRVNNVKLGANGRDRTNCWEAPGANQRGSSAQQMLQFHSTPKPTELCVDAILDVTNRGEIVLDPFIGSGTTIIAAHRTGRRCVGIELDPKYVDVAVQRWERESGHAAILSGTRLTFSEIAEQRLAALADGAGERTAPVPARDWGGEA